MGRTEGKVVVVTGAAGGQGAAEARALAAEGATVIATDLAAPELDAPISGRPLDVTDPAAWSALAGWLRERHGRVDWLVNNARIAIDGGQSAHGGAKSLSDAVLREAAMQTREE